MGRLLAIADLHLAHERNRQALAGVSDHPDDWLVLAGDVGERPDHLVLALETLAPRFARLIWTPGNHDLWCRADATDRTRGQARYDELVDICRRFGVLTPEDPYVEWPGEPGTFVVPMFLLFDYTFRPAEISAEQALSWAAETGVVSRDESALDATPWPSREAWCHARCAATVSRLDALPPNSRTVLINHWPLRYDLARPPRVPRFSLWCGTTMWRHGIRYEEVSLGYPRDWRIERGIDWYLRDILPGDGPDANRFVPPRDPFR